MNLSFKPQGVVLCDSSPRSLKTLFLSLVDFFFPFYLLFCELPAPCYYKTHHLIPVTNGKTPFLFLTFPSTSYRWSTSVPRICFRPNLDCTKVKLPFSSAPLSATCHCHAFPQPHLNFLMALFHPISETSMFVNFSL